RRVRRRRAAGAHHRRGHGGDAVTAPKFVWDDAAAQALFRRLIDAGRDTAPLLSKLAYSLGERARLTFHDQTDPWGRAWKPLSAVTLRMRRDQGRSGVSILRDTGQLLASLAS